MAQVGRSYGKIYDGDSQMNEAWETLCSLGENKRRSQVKAQEIFPS